MRVPSDKRISVFSVLPCQGVCLVSVGGGGPGEAFGRRLMVGSQTRQAPFSRNAKTSTLSSGTWLGRRRTNSDGLQPGNDGLRPRSNGLQPSSVRLQPRSNDLQPSNIRNEANSDGLQGSSGRLQPSSDGLQPNSDGLHPSSNGLQPRSNGLQPSNDGLQPPIATASNLNAKTSTLSLGTWLGRRRTTAGKRSPCGILFIIPFRRISADQT